MYNTDGDNDYIKLMKKVEEIRSNENNSRFRSTYLKYALLIIYLQEFCIFSEEKILPTYFTFFNESLKYIARVESKKGLRVSASLLKPFPLSPLD